MSDRRPCSRAARASLRFRATRVWRPSCGLLYQMLRLRHHRALAIFRIVPLAHERKLVWPPKRSAARAAVQFSSSRLVPKTKSVALMWFVREERLPKSAASFFATQCRSKGRARPRALGYSNRVEPLNCRLGREPLKVMGRFFSCSRLAG